METAAFARATPALVMKSSASIAGRRVEVGGLPVDTAKAGCFRPFVVRPGAMMTLEFFSNSLWDFVLNGYTISMHLHINGCGGPCELISLHRRYKAESNGSLVVALWLAHLLTFDRPLALFFFFNLACEETLSGEYLVTRGTGIQGFSWRSHNLID